MISLEPGQVCAIIPKTRTNKYTENIVPQILAPFLLSTDNIFYHTRSSTTDLNKLTRHLENKKLILYICTDAQPTNLDKGYIIFLQKKKPDTAHFFVVFQSFVANSQPRSSSGFTDIPFLQYDSTNDMIQINDNYRTSSQRLNKIFEYRNSLDQAIQDTASHDIIPDKVVYMGQDDLSKMLLFACLYV